MARAPIGLVGKLPASADFLRVGANTAAFQRLYGWMIDGVQQLASTRPDWAAQLGAGSVQAMFFRERRGSTALAGALAPSVDAAGRRFPIAAACEFKLDGLLVSHPEALPLVLESVWSVTGQLVLDLQHMVRSELEGAQPTAEADVGVRDAVAAYRRWTDELELDDFVALVFGGDAQRAAAALALTDEAVQPYQGVEDPETSLSLRLPLGQVGGAAVCFWLDLVERLTGWRRTVPSFFWSHDGTSGVLMLHLGHVPPVALSELWLPTGNCDAVCDLVLPAGAFRSSRASRWERIMAERDMMVSDLLRAAGTKSARGV
jgi:type VI secretion system ImpM family protein